MPIPAPTTSMKPPTSTRLVRSSIVPISARPTVSSVAPRSIQRLYTPVRLTIRPIVIEAPNRPTTIGMVSRPDSVGDIPRAICMYWVRKTVVPNIAMPTATLAITASTTVRSANSRSGMIGSRTRRSTSTAASRSPAPASTSAAVCHEAHAYCWPASETQISRAETPAAISVAPTTSIRTSRRRRGRCSVRWSTTDAAIANGTPIAKHQRQPSPSVTTPPSSGPTTVPTPNVAPR